MIGEDPLHPNYVKLQVGDWIQLLTPNFLKRGEILLKRGRSLLVLWQGHPTPTAIPDAAHYFDLAQPSEWAILKVPRERRLAPPSKVASVAQTASLLGTDAKTVRRLLRAGKLRGRRVDGRWVADASSIRENRASQAAMGSRDSRSTAE